MKLQRGANSDQLYYICPKCGYIATSTYKYPQIIYK